MPRSQASRELLASLDDAWRFVSDPAYLAEWWPGVAAIERDRRGLAPGARWTVRGTNQPTLFRSPNPTGMLLVLAVEERRRFEFKLTGERLDAEIALEASAPEGTTVTLTARAPLLVGLGRSFARKALNRLYSLCQTAAEL